MPMPSKSSSRPKPTLAVKWNQKDQGEKDLWNRWILSLVWKAEGVTDGYLKDYKLKQLHLINGS